MGRAGNASEWTIAKRSQPGQKVQLLRERSASAPMLESSHLLVKHAVAGSHPLHCTVAVSHLAAERIAVQQTASSRQNVCDFSIGTVERGADHTGCAVSITLLTCHGADVLGTLLEESALKRAAARSQSA
eukprot:822273-Pleurochrysis_carterae.AAC.3